jgi:hypothetical protein
MKSKLVALKRIGVALNKADKFLKRTDVAPNKDGCDPKQEWCGSK